MDLKRLEILGHVIEQQSFSKAARIVGLSQPSVSEHIRLLEEEIGERLLDRLGREVLPTPAGKLLYGYAQKLLRLHGEARLALDRFRGDLRGTLALGASTIPGNYLLPQLTAAFNTEHPAIQVRVQIASTGSILEQIYTGSLELGLVGACQDRSRFEFQPLLTDELVLALPAGHPWAARKVVELADLAGEPFVLRGSGSGTRRAVEEALQRQGVELGRLQVVAEFGSPEAIRQAVRAGIGIAILSARVVAEDVARGELATVSVKGLSLERSFYIASRVRRQLSPLAEAMRDFLCRVAAEQSGLKFG